MPNIDVTRCGDLNTALRRLKRLCEKLGVLSGLRDNFYVKPSEARRKAKNAAIRRANKKRDRK